MFTLIVTTSSLIHAQTFIKGKVVDADSRQPLENAVILNTNDPKANALTDQYGNFSLKTDKTKTNLSISYLGYKALTISAEGNNDITIEMKPDAVNLKDIVLSTNSATKFSTIARIDLDLKPVRNTQELLRLVPGLFIAQHAGGGKAEQIFLRGFD